MENGAGREEEFQHKPPSIDTLESINRTDMKDGEKKLVFSERGQRKGERVKGRRTGQCVKVRGGPLPGSP